MPSESVLGANKAAHFTPAIHVALIKVHNRQSRLFFNALLVSDNDLGSLNSELYARYWVNDKIGIRAGLSFQFIEYTTDKVLTFETTDSAQKTFYR